jgi:hypothetical protein
MPDHREAPIPRVGTVPLMGTIVLALVTLLAAVIALALGLNWEHLLHWTGELLLIIGIVLAAKGISDVRREWTQLPGAWGSVRQEALRIGARAASFIWLRWNRALERWPVLARRLRLRVHVTHVHAADVVVTLDVANIRFAAPPGRVIVSGGLTVETRLDQLDRLMADALAQLDALTASHEREIMDRHAGADRERAERTAEARAIRDRVATLAGGGLRLQAWGVACLLAGTIMTAIW